MSLKRKVTTGLLWAAGQSTTQQVVGLVGFGIMAAILGPHPYGLVAMELVIVSLVSALLNQGLLEGLIQRAQIKASQLDSMFWFVQGASVLFAAGMFATADAVARLYGQPQLADIQRLMSLAPMFIAAAAVPTVLVRRELQFRTLAIRTMVAVVVGAAVGIGLAIGGAGVWAIVAMQLTQYALNGAVLWAVTSWRPGLQFSWRELQGLLAYGLQLVALRGLSYFDSQGPRFIVGYALGPVPLGYLHFATTVQRFIAQLFISPFNIVGMPVVARVQSDPAKVDRLLLTATRFANLLVYPAFIGLAAIAPILVPVAFGTKWLPAVPVLQILTVSGIGRIYVGMYDATLRGLGKPRWLLITRTAQAVFTVVLTLLAAPYGLAVIAAVLAIKGIVFLPLNVWILQRAGGPRLGPVMAANLPTLLAAALMGACVFGWIQLMYGELTAWTLLGTAIAIGIASYAVFALIFVRSALRDMLLLLRSVRAPTSHAQVDR